MPQSGGSFSCCISYGLEGGPISLDGIIPIFFTVDLSFSWTAKHLLFFLSISFVVLDF